MFKLCAVAFAALLVSISTVSAWAQDVTLKSHDGDVEISGDLLGFDGEFYRVDSIYGELTVDGSGVLCSGPGCPDLEHFIARATFSGAPIIGRILMPALLEAFSIQRNYEVTRVPVEANVTQFVFSRREDDTVLGEFTIRLSNSDEGFADLLGDETDIVMSLREIQTEEAARGREAGLGDLSASGRARVLALDALVPVVEPGNPVQAITVPQLAQVLAGEITNWTALGGPDAPVTVEVHSDQTGLGQATRDQLLTPPGLTLSENAGSHATGPELTDAVMADPFAIGVTSRADTGNTWTLALKGECGFAMRATRRAVKTEDYPLTTPLFLYLPARRFPKLVREFLTYLRDPSAQLVIRRAGFVDQAPEEIEINAQGNRFANAIAQAGEETDLAELQRMIEVLSPLKRLTTTFRFQPGSTRLDAQSRANVKQLARAMELGLYDARRLVFVGFSDGDGASEPNRKIALRRAGAVRQAVSEAAETANLARIGLETVAFGEAMPMACDDTEWGREVNRRVEIWVR